MGVDFRSRTFHVCMSMEWLSRTMAFPRDYVGLVRTTDGEVLSPEAALAHFTTQKAMGRKVIPMNPECGKPCAHEKQGCSGFDYSGSGCPGYLNNDQGSSSEAAA